MRAAVRFTLFGRVSQFLTPLATSSSSARYARNCTRGPFRDFSESVTCAFGIAVY